MITLRLSIIILYEIVMRLRYEVVKLSKSRVVSPRLIYVPLFPYN